MDEIDVTKIKQYHLGQTDSETLLKRYISFVLSTTTHKQYLEGCPYLLVVGVTILFDIDMVIYGFPTADERERCRASVVKYTQEKYKNGRDLFCVEENWSFFENVQRAVWPESQGN